MGERKKEVELHEKYQPLFTSQNRYFYLKGGRGSGKSFFVSVFALLLSYEKGHKILFTRYTLTSAEKSIIPEFIEKIELMGLESHFYVTANSIVNRKTGVEILFLGIKTSSGNQTANLKSLTGVTTWIYDEFEEHPDFLSFDKIDLSFRVKGIQNRIILVSNALHKQSWQHKTFFGSERKDITYILTDYRDNLSNLDQVWIRKADKCRETNIIKYNRDFLGLDYEETENALWKKDWLQVKLASLNTLVKVVVAIDPAVSNNENSDETGIVVLGIDRNGIGWVLDDHSGKYSPNEWAKVAIQAYQTWKANSIVAEVNQGGDLVKSNIHSVDRSVHVKQIRASRGKHVRAEPVVALYERGLVIHSKQFAKLEYQMLTWNPSKKNDSPDRVDALVHGLTELMIKPANPKSLKFTAG